ncbi:hypothetical protein HAX54_009453, partial [Datura stramonium]|nr:hypothetical protein [Datura stramonium]
GFGSKRLPMIRNQNSAMNALCMGMRRLNVGTEEKEGRIGSLLPIGEVLAKEYDDTLLKPLEEGKQVDTRGPKRCGNLRDAVEESIGNFMPSKTP